MGATQVIGRRTVLSIPEVKRCQSRSKGRRHIHSVVRPAGRPETLPGQAAETPAAQTPVSASAPAE